MWIANKSRALPMPTRDLFAVRIPFFWKRYMCSSFIWRFRFGHDTIRERTLPMRGYRRQAKVRIPDVFFQIWNFKSMALLYNVTREKNEMWIASATYSRFAFRFPGKVIYVRHSFDVSDLNMIPYVSERHRYINHVCSEARNIYVNHAR